MDSVRIYFKVKDFGKWKQIFDEDVKSGLLADKAGVIKYDLQRMVDSGETSLYFELKSSDQFKEFLKSDETQKRIKEAGIEGSIRSEFMNRIEEGKPESGKKEQAA